jgi:hypothetical protein
MEGSLRPWYGNGVRLGAREVGGCDRACLNSLRALATTYALCFPESLKLVFNDLVVSV